jgi:hypothetical protein
MAVSFHVYVRADVRAGSEEEARDLLLRWVRGALDGGEPEQGIAISAEIGPSRLACDEAHTPNAHPVCVDVPVSVSSGEQSAQWVQEAIEAKAIRWVAEQLDRSGKQDGVSSIDIAAH